MERRLAANSADPSLCGACREKREKLRALEDHRTQDGTPLTDPEEMCGRARDFYASLFSPDPTDPGACGVLWEELPTVSVGDRDRLELPLTLAEFSEALRRMPTNKSPGMDGLTVEFYRAFWDILGPDLVTVWAGLYCPGSQHFRQPLSSPRPFGTRVERWSVVRPPVS
ncbi:unnamed protein product [Caretta caretta]